MICILEGAPQKFARPLFSEAMKTVEWEKRIPQMCYKKNN